MPIIPQFTEQSRMNVGSPVPIGSTNDDRQMGDAIQTFGQQVLGAGHDLSQIAEIDARKQNVKRTLDANAFKESFRSQALQIHDNVMRTGAANGDGWVQTFNEQSQKWLDDNSKAIDDPITKKMALNDVADIRNDFNTKLYEDSRKQWVATGMQQVEDKRNALGAQVAQDPTFYESAVKEFDTYLNGDGATNHGVKDLLPPDKVQAYAVNSKQEWAKDAVRSMALNGNYDQARQALETKFSGQFNAETHDNISKEIQRYEDAQFNRDVREERRQDVEAAKALKDSQRTNALNMADKIFNAGAPDQRQKLALQNEQMLSTNQISQTQYSFNKRLLDGEVKVDDNRLKVSFVDRINKGEDLDRLETEVMDAHSAEQLGSQNASTLLNIIRGQKERELHDPTFKIKQKSAKELMDANFGKDSLIELMPKEQRELKANALVEMNAAVIKGADPVAAARSVIKKYLPDINSAPFIPKIDHSDQFDEKGLSKAGQDLIKLHENKAITIKELKDSLLKLKTRRDALRRAQVK